MPKMSFGWRARIAMIYPASGLADMEYYHLCSAFQGVSIHVVRIGMPHGDRVILEDMVELASSEELKRAADLATLIRPNAICFACTSGSFSRGPDWDEKLRGILSTHGRCPATTTSTALISGLQALGAQKVALATPYERRLNEKLVQYVEHFGFEVVNDVGLGLTLDWDIGRLGPAELNDLVHRADTPDADVLFVSDTGIVLSPFVEALEADLGKPVFSANIASMWHALRLAGVRESQPGLGRLFQIG